MRFKELNHFSDLSRFRDEGQFTLAILEKLFYSIFLLYSKGSQLIKSPVQQCLFREMVRVSPDNHNHKNPQQYKIEDQLFGNRDRFHTNQE